MKGQVECIVLWVQCSEFIVLSRSISLPVSPQLSTQIKVKSPKITLKKTTSFTFKIITGGHSLNKTHSLTLFVNICS